MDGVQEYNGVDLLQRPVLPLFDHGMEATGKYLFYAPLELSPGPMFIDVDRDTVSVVSRDGQNEDERAYMIASGMQASAMEHGIWEEILEVPAVSTIKILDEANQRGIPIYTVTSENINRVLPELEVSQAVKNDISNAVNSGRIVTIPKQNITYFDWKGTGYMMLDPNSGAAAYMISGGTAGGCTSIAVILSFISISITCFLALVGLVEMLGLVYFGVMYGSAVSAVLLGLADVALIGLTEYFLGDSFYLFLKYLLYNDISAGEAVITRGILSLAAPVIGKYLSKYIAMIPGVKNIFAYILELQSAQELAAIGYSEAFIKELAKKSGINALTQVRQLISELQGMGISPAFIEQAVNRSGLESLNVIKGLLQSGVTKSEIGLLINSGLNITDDILYLAQRGLLPSQYEVYGIINSTEAEWVTKFLRAEFSPETIQALVNKGLQPSEYYSLYIRTASEAEAALAEINLYWRSLNTQNMSGQTGEYANTWWKKVNPNMKDPYLPGTRVYESEFTEDVVDNVFVRFYDKVDSTIKGNWVARFEDIQGLTPKQIQDLLALKYEPKFICKVQFNATDKLRVGIAGPQPEWGVQGGGIQYDLMNKYIGNFVDEVPMTPDMPVISPW